MVKGDGIGDFGRRLGEAPGEASGPGLCAGARSAIVRKRESASSRRRLALPLPGRRV